MFSPQTQAKSDFHVVTRRASRLWLVGLVAVALIVLVYLLQVTFLGKAQAPPETRRAAAAKELFARDNLVAWCIVPFDARKRSPEQRAAMLKRLGFRHFAYDWRAEHLPMLERELKALKENGIKLTACWFPTTLNKDARFILDMLRKHRLKTQLWVMGGGGPATSPEEQKQRVATEAARLRPIAEEAARIGCTVGLYNHGGWFGEPENQLAIIEQLKLPNVGIVYNLHHGHEHLNRFPALLQKMRPHLLAVNLNGMVKDGPKAGKHILPLGAGDLDLQLLRTICDSGYRGPIGILGHTMDDAEQRLADNLAGLDWLVPQLAGKKPGPRPQYRTYHVSAAPRAPEAPKTRVQSSKENHYGKDAIGFNWTEGDSRDDRWKDMDIGRFLASALPLPSGRGTVAKGLSIRIGEKSEATVCYDTGHFKLRAAWTGGFLRFTPARFGLIAPPQINGIPLLACGAGPGWLKAAARYQGMYVHGERVVLSCGLTPEAPAAKPVTALEFPWLENRDGQAVFTRTLEVSAAAVPLTMILADLAGAEKAELRRTDQGDLVVLHRGKHVVVLATAAAKGLQLAAPERGPVTLTLPPHAAPLRFQVRMAAGTPADLAKLIAAAQAAVQPENLQMLARPGPAQWTANIVTRGVVAADDAAYVVDTLTMPFDNPYKALLFAGGHDLFANGDIALCTVHGDVWRISGVDRKLERLVWKRLATGLFQPLGLKVVDDHVYVLGRDQITRLHDRNGDGEADFYENFCNLGHTSPGNHDYTTCLETDAAGNFYYLTAKDGLLRVSRDGRCLDKVAEGFRNPNGLGIGPGDMITVAPQEGEWTPASNIVEIKQDGYYGYGGPRVQPGRPLGYDSPLCWIPRRQDNSGGGQVWVTSERWGPLQGQMLHLSYGQCRMMLVLREVVKPGVVQGGTVGLPPIFASGVMRGRFSPKDGQLYVSGLKGWVTAATQDGCLQRVRYTGRPVDLPVRARTYKNGLALTFTRPLDKQSVEDAGNFFVEQWNYQYRAAYGSPDLKVSDPRKEGHDEVTIASATLLDDGRTVFLEIPELRPVMQLAIGYVLKARDGAKLRQNLLYTINAVGKESMDPARLARSSRAHLLSKSEQDKLRPGLAVHFAQAGKQDARASRLAALFVPRQASPTPFLQPGSFRAIFAGYLRMPLRADVAFSLKGRGTALLRVNGKEVLHGNGDLASLPAAAVSLHGGFNTLALEYSSPPDDSGAVRLFWQGEDFPLEPVPPTILLHRGDDVPLTAGEMLRHGRELFAQGHCARCHGLPAGLEPGKVEMPEMLWSPPSLAAAGKRWQTEWIAQWLLGPRQVHDHATMPDLLPRGDPARRQKAADLAAYLTTLEAPATATPGNVKPGDATAGARLFDDLGCRNCHRFTPPEGKDAATRMTLAFVGAKYRPGQLEAYLRKPQAHHAASRMPDFHLTPAEASALAAFLRREARGKIQRLAEIDHADAKRGGTLFHSLHCVNCHATGAATDRPEPILPLTGKSNGKGCLATDRAARGTAPGFAREPPDRAALLAFLATDGRSLARSVPAEAAQRLMKSLKCAACHDRDTTLSTRWLLVEEEGSSQLPDPLPNLTWTGEKLRTTWVERFLAGKLDYRPRPHLKMRMPSFPTHARLLAQGLAEEHGIDPNETAVRIFDKQLAEIGNKLTLNTGLDCRQCHAIGREPLPGDAKTQIAIGIPFRYAGARLREEFFPRFVLDPPRYDLQTKMPKFIQDGRTTKVTTIFGGDARRQIQALWHFLLSVDQERGLSNRHSETRH
jgi:hypothetical protein